MSTSPPPIGEGDTPASPRPAATPHPRLAALDGVRGLAILMVVVGHVFAQFGGWAAGTRDWMVTLANPQLGVRIFFTLSGYLITHLLLEESARRGRIDLCAFWARRARRILPAFIVFMVCVGLWGALSPGAVSWPHWWAAATFTWNYALPWLPASGDSTWLLGHTWSLAVEAQFYLLWPFLLVRLGSRRALSWALVLLVAQPFVRIAFYLLVPQLRGYLGMMLHTSADGLLAGCAAAILARDPGAAARLFRISPWLAVLWLLGLSPLLSLMLRGFWLYAGSTLDALSAALLIIHLHHAPASRLHSLLARGPLPWLGLISYSLYLWQQLFLDARFGGGMVLAPVLGAVLAAVFSWRFVERPLLRKSIPAPAAPSRDDRARH